MEDRRKAGSFAWLDSKEAEGRVSPPTFFFFFKAGGSVAKPHTLMESEEKDGNKDWKRGAQRKRLERLREGEKKPQKKPEGTACLTSLLISNTPSWIFS